MRDFIEYNWRTVLFIMLAVLILIGGILIGALLMPGRKSVTAECEASQYAVQVYRENIHYKYEGARAALIDEIDKYIRAVAPKSNLNGSVVFNECEKAGVDIKFVLAQGHLESHFGTLGTAARTNSVFNVHAVDGVSADSLILKGHCFKHPDMSVAPYLKLLTEDYIAGKSSEKDLFDGFVNRWGCRYASSMTYEKDLLKIYSEIDAVADISEKISDYMKYKTLLN